MDMFKVATRNWLAPTFLSQASSGFAAAAAGGLVLFTGGYDGSDKEHPHFI
jgi:hypothetical protein